MFKIGEFSKITNVTVRALHHYETIDLLRPKTIDEFSGYRYYSAEQIAKVNQIKTLQTIGLPLKAVKEVLESTNQDILKQYYDLRMVEIEEEIHALKRKQQLVKEYSKKMEEGIYMEKYNVELKEVPKRQVMSLRKTIPTFSDEGSLWEALYEELLKQKVKMTTPPKGMSFYHDQEYVETNVDVEVQSEVIGDYSDTAEVRFFDTEPFTLASVTFSGGYDQMPEVTQAIGLWIEANGYELAGPMVNISHVSPAQEADPNKWVTEAGFIVKKA